MAWRSLTNYTNLGIGREEEWRRSSNFQTAKDKASFEVPPPIVTKNVPVGSKDK